MRHAPRSLAFIAALTACGIAQGRTLPVIDMLGDSPVAATFAAKAKAASRPNRFVSAHVDERLDVPTFLWIDAAAKGTTAKAFAAMSPEAAARAHLKGVADLYRITSAEVDAAPLHHVETLPNGATIAKFTSRREGIEVFRESAAVLMDAAGQALAVGGFIGSMQTLAPRAAVTRGNGGDNGNRGIFTLTPATAVAIAMGDYGFEPAIAAEFIRHVPALDAAAHAAEGYEHFTLPGIRASAAGSRLTTPARAKRVWFRLPQGLVPAYYVELQMYDARHDSHDGYSYVIAADDGRLLFRNNLTADAAFNYKVWAETNGINLPYPGPQGRNATPHPTGLNDGFQPAFVPQNDVTLQNGPLSTNDPWLAPGATQTIGNNVEAWANHTGAPLVPPATVINDGTFDADPNECDLLAPQVGDFHACVSSPGNFSYVFDPAVGANATKTQVMAAVTQLFYTTNWLHDWYYDAGFREIDGNAQADNYGRGGLGNDSMKAQAQDYSGTNNANMNTPADGARPRMRMYLFTGTGNAIFTVSSPLLISGNYPVTTAAFGAQTFNLVSPLVQAIDPADAAGALTTDGCSPLTNAAAIAGNIAVIDRGTCTFVTKVKNAQNAGAVGVLIANSAAGAFSGMGGTDPTITIPVLMITNAAGASIKAQLTNNGGPGVTGNLRRVSGVDRDGTIDNSVVAHEWGHYISNRLIGNANGITTTMSRGLGEGWADFHALLMMVKPEDALIASNTTFNGTYAEAGYVSDGPQIAGITQSAAHYYGIRRYPYSTDFAKNPLTFKHIQNGAAFALPASPPPAFSDFNNNAEVHSTGEVWATMLWGCYASLLRDTSRLTFAQAQDRMKRYLVASYKLTPVNPTLVEARDALFAAMAAQDPADVALCMSAFAQRGAGLRAAFTGDRYSGTNVGVVESFTAGNDLQIASINLDTRSALYCDADTFLDNGETGTLTVAVRNTGAGTLTGTTVSISSGPGLTFPSGSLASVPAIAPFATANATFTVRLSGAPDISTVTVTAAATDPSLAIPGPVSASLALRVQRDRALAVSASDDIEDPVTVWTPSLGSGTTDAALNWTRVTVSATDHHWNGPSGESAGVAWLTSPPLAVSATGPFNLSFKHRFAFGFGSTTNDDGGVIEISDDGGTTWVDVNTVVPGIYGGTSITNYTGTINPLAGRPGFARESIGNPAYTTATITFPSTYLGKTVLIRFGVGTDAGGHLTGWDIDDIAFTGITNTPFPGYVNDPQTCVTASATGGTPQSSALNTTFATPLQVRVLTPGAQPVPGAAVAFQVPGSGASGTFAGGVTAASVLTDAGGFATAPAFTANGTAGAYNVVANAGVSTVNFTLTNGAPTSVALLSVASRKTHGAAGAFDIPIDRAPPVAGPISVEPRTIGTGHMIVFHFDGAIGVAGSAAAVDPIPGPAVGASPMASGNDVIVTLTGVPDNHRLTVTLTGVNGTVNTAASLGFLVGDVNGTRGVTPADVQQVKARSGQAVDATNFRFDVNASGVITAADIVTVKQRTGLQLP